SAHMDAIESGIGAKLARQIAGARHFDLDDIGAKLGKLIAAEWTSQHIGQVEDAHTREKSAHRPSATPVMPTAQYVIPNVRMIDPLSASWPGLVPAIHAFDNTGKVRRGCPRQARA